ncbi:MAG: hypothetical protein V4489_07815 [Chlamydiota bacterium]
MNRRHNLSNIRLVKQEHKEVKKGMRTDTPVDKKSLKEEKALITETLKRHKKVSKRDSTGESIENSPPSYPHKEGGRWIATLRAQQSDKTIRGTKKATKSRG